MSGGDKVGSGSVKILFSSLKHGATLVSPSKVKYKGGKKIVFKFRGVICGILHCSLVAFLLLFYFLGKFSSSFFHFRFCLQAVRREQQQGSARHLDEEKSTQAQGATPEEGEGHGGGEGGISEGGEKDGAEVVGESGRAGGIQDGGGEDGVQGVGGKGGREGDGEGDGGEERADLVASADQQGDGGGGGRDMLPLPDRQPSSAEVILISQTGRKFFTEDDHHLALLPVRVLAQAAYLLTETVFALRCPRLPRRGG